MHARSDIRFNFEPAGMTSCATWRKFRPTGECFRISFMLHIGLEEAPSSCATATRTMYGTCSTKAWRTYRSLTLSRTLRLRTSTSRVGTFLAHVPWLGVYLSHIPLAVRPLEILIQHCRGLTEQRIKRGSMRRDLFHYLVRPFSIPSP